jgi:hypothetical protein
MRWAFSDDETLGGLAEDLVEANHGENARGDHVAQDHARADRRQLVLVAHEQEPGAVGQGRDQIREQADVDHRCLVDDQHVGLERPR